MIGPKLIKRTFDSSANCRPTLSRVPLRQGFPAHEQDFPGDLPLGLPSTVECTPVHRLLIVRDPIHPSGVRTAPCSARDRQSLLSVISSIDFRLSPSC